MHLPVKCISLHKDYGRKTYHHVVVTGHPSPHHFCILIAMIVLGSMAHFPPYVTCTVCTYHCISKRWTSKQDISRGGVTPQQNYLHQTFNQHHPLTSVSPLTPSKGPQINPTLDIVRPLTTTKSTHEVWRSSSEHFVFLKLSIYKHIQY